MRNFRFAPGTSSLRKFPRVLAYPIPGQSRLLMPSGVAVLHIADPLRLFLSKEIFHSPASGFPVPVKCAPKGHLSVKIFNMNLSVPFSGRFLQCSHVRSALLHRPYSKRHLLLFCQWRRRRCTGRLYLSQKLRPA